MEEPKTPDIWKGDLQPQQNVDQAIGEDTSYPAETWREIAGLLNISLSQEQGNMFDQISLFLRSNTAASGQETLSWSEEYQSHEHTVATADVKFPREPHWGIPTKGWYLFHYKLHDGSVHITIIAEKANTTKSTETSGTEISFTRQQGSAAFQLDKREYHEPWSDYIYGMQSPLIPYDIGRRISRYRKLGAKDVAVFHVYNQRPSLPSGQKGIVKR